MHHNFATEDIIQKPKYVNTIVSNNSMTITGSLHLEWVRLYLCK